MEVLIVDDDDKSRKLLVDVLRLRNITVHQAVNGAEAINLALPGIKLCFIDIKLPDMSGNDVAGKIKNKCPGTSLIAYTASGLMDDVNNIEKSGLFDDILQKPIKLELLVGIIDKYLY